MQTVETQNNLNYLETVRSLVHEDWENVNRIIVKRLGSDVALVNQVAHHITHGGGKRLRPLTTLLAARACGYEKAKHIPAAAIIEFIHTATLLHDDVVDESGLRRGQETANAAFGNQASVLVGDFLYSRAFQMMVEIGEIEILDILADTTNTIAEGEVLQLMNCNNPDIKEENYLEIIYRKTAKLFEAATHCGAILANPDKSIQQNIRDYGRHLGSAFQLVDDALDYDSTTEELGKNIGDDLAEGKPTLPLIYAMEHGSAAERNMIREAIETGGTQNLTSIQIAIESSGGLQYTADCARKEVQLAIKNLDVLPKSKYKDGLRSLAMFAINRRF
ncbi:MAG: octaprenyl diphosphate synthase [Rhodospirillaceae bacterium]|nr:octaprenyl diphosphate synthase [Rhodospirillaceae bacterium]